MSTKELPWTGERYVPQVRGTVALEHLHRYAYAAQFVKDKIVLDIACGEGYGSEMMARKASHVYGVDIDKLSVDHATERYAGTSNLSFAEGSCESIPLSDKTVDIVVSFETLEHTSEQDLFIREMKRVLKPGGFVIISTPEKAAYAVANEKSNPYHSNELTHEEFDRLLKANFTDVAMLGQQILRGSFIAAETIDCSSAAVFEFHKLPAECKPEIGLYKSLYLIAFCTDAGLPKIVSSLCKQNIWESEELNKAIEEQAKELENLKASTCWKVTKPLRATANGVKHFRMLAKISKAVVTKIANPSFVVRYVREAKRVYQQRGFRGVARAASRFFQSRIARQDVSAFETITVVEPNEVTNIPGGLPHHEFPKVSVIISAYNNLKFTSHCVNSIKASTPSVPYEIIIADDGSTDQTHEWCTRVKNLRHVITGHRQGFVLNNNEAAKVAKGEFLVFLNNDTVVQPGWLDSLAKTFEWQSNVGLVGSQLIYGSGALQEAGGIVWRDGSAWNFGRNEDPGKPEFNYTRDVDYCSAAAIMIPKSVFDELGGFDSLFAPAYYEDTDLAFRVRQFGMRVVYQPKARVVHFEGKSNGTSLTEGLKKYQGANAAKFRERWKRSLESHQLNGESLDKAKDRSKSNRVLFLDQCTPTPDKDSGSIDALNIMLMLREMGFQVTFAPVSNFLHCGAYTENLQSEGIEVLYSPFVTSLRAHLESCNNRYDLIFACRYNTLQDYYKYIKQYCKKAKLLFHTVDLHFLRLQREANLFQNKKLSAFAKQTKSVELDLIRKSDVATVVSQAECDLLRESVQPFNVRTLPYTRHIPGARTSYRDREGIVFVGSYLHPPNIDAVLFFTKEVLPLVHAKLPDVVFHIVGADPPEEVRALEGRRVKVMGHVKDLDSLMNSMRASVAPLRFGAGIKGKVGQSLAYGVPVVATPLAAEGMGLTDRKEILLAEETLEMAELLCAVYTSEKLWEKLSQQGIEAASSRFGINKGYTNLAKILSELGLRHIPSAPRSSDLRLRG